MISSWDVMDSIRDAVEDYGQNCWQDGYDEAKDEFESSFDTAEEIILKHQGMLSENTFIKAKQYTRGLKDQIWC